MDDVLAYLELKNRYYSKFLTITEKFLQCARANDWERIDLFVDSRERILNIIKAFDFKIAEAFGRQDLSSPELEEYRPRVKQLMDQRTALVNRIVTIDLELIQSIEEMKTETIRDLKNTIARGQQIQSFDNIIPIKRKVLKHSV